MNFNQEILAQLKLTKTQMRILELFAKYERKSPNQCFKPYVVSLNLFGNTKLTLGVGSSMHSLYRKKLLNFSRGRNQFEPGIFLLSDTGRLLVGMKQYEKGSDGFEWCFPDDVPENAVEYTGKHRMVPFLEQRGGTTYFDK